jgi:hypothetical protein
MKKDRHAGAIKSDGNKESFKKSFRISLHARNQNTIQKYYSYQPCYSIQLSNLLKVSVQYSNISRISLVKFSSIATSLAPQS